MVTLMETILQQSLGSIKFHQGTHPGPIHADVIQLINKCMHLSMGVGALSHMNL